MNKPIVTVRYKTLDIAVFENQIPNTTHMARNAVISKSYKSKKTDKWEKQSITISHDQMLELATMLDHTFWEIDKLDKKQVKDEPKEETKDEPQEESNELEAPGFDDIPFSLDR